MDEVQRLRIDTTSGTIAVYSTASSGAKKANTPTLLLIHGNSFCSKIFRHILTSSVITRTYHVLAMDLPGHGDSEDAPDPELQYTQTSYAATAVEVLTRLEVEKVVVLGWSLGGHTGIEMLPLLGSQMKGLMIVGSPPVGYGEVNEGFTFGKGGWQTSYAARSQLTPEEQSDYAHVCADPPYEPWMLDAVRRTDKIARSNMFNHFESGKVSDQRKLVGESKVPIAVINGKDEPYINLEFLRNVQYGNLWRGECIEMDGLLHAPFWGDPGRFEPLLKAFLDDCSR